MAFNKLFIEHNRFYFGVSPLLKQVILVVAGLGFLTFGLAGFLGHISDVPVILSGVFSFFGVICVIALIADIFGLGFLKDYKTQPNWGADERGVFFMSTEGKISHYNWDRIHKIVITDAITYHGDIDDALIGETLILHASGYAKMKSVRRPKAILFHIDKMNEMEGRLAQKIYTNIVAKAKVIAVSYSGVKPTEMMRLLQKYMPSHLTVERAQELKLDG